MAAEVLKQAAHGGRRSSLFHYRDATGLEVDLVSGAPRSVILTESASGATVACDFTKSVERLALGVRQREPDLAVTTRVVYGGAMRQTRGSTEIIPWHEIDQCEWHESLVRA